MGPEAAEGTALRCCEVRTGGSLVVLRRTWRERASHRSAHCHAPGALRRTPAASGAHRRPLTARSSAGPARTTRGRRFRALRWRAGSWVCTNHAWAKVSCSSRAATDPPWPGCVTHRGCRAAEPLGVRQPALHASAVGTAGPGGSGGVQRHRRRGDTAVTALQPGERLLSRGTTPSPPTARAGPAGSVGCGRPGAWPSTGPAWPGGPDGHVDGRLEDHAEGGTCGLQVTVGQLPALSGLWDRGGP